MTGESWLEAAAAGFQQVGLDYRWSVPETPLRFRTLDIMRQRETLIARIAVDEVQEDGKGYRRYDDNVRLTDGRSRTDFAKQLWHRTRGAYGNEAVMQRLVDWFAIRVEAANRRVSDPPRRVVGQAGRVQANSLIDPILVDHKPTWLFAPGGSGKGWIATLLCVAMTAGRDVAGLKVTPGEALYLDWEDDEDTFAERVYLVSRGMHLPPQSIHYWQMSGPIKHYVRELRAYIQEHNIRLVVVDSVGMACGTNVGGGYEESAFQLHEVLRLLGCAVLAIDHVAGNESGGDSNPAFRKAYGSVFKTNLARLAWSAKAEEETGQGRLRVGLFNTKANWGAKRRPIGIEFDFSVADEVRASSFDIRNSDELITALPRKEQIKAILRDGAMGTKDIAAELDMRERQVERYLRRGKRAGIFVLVGKDTWGLTQYEPTSSHSEEAEIPGW